ncbi:MAG: hypothetical protein GY952_11730 [Rhodobacteraceae bacterium]|nr:hypothetical protein [Paracoccaceae bacterium]
MERRLAAILAIDVVGYTLMMGRDEEATLASLYKTRALIDQLVGENDGRTFGVAGDSVIAEFASPVKAIGCAIEIQRQMVKLNQSQPEGQHIQLRIGANLGDAIVDEGNLFGEGVNIAARLEQMSAAGGIIISRAVRDQVRDRLTLDLADLGEIEVKNVSRPVHCFQILQDGEAPQRVPKPPIWQRRKYVYAAVLVVVVGVFAYGWHLQRHDFTPVDPANMAFALPERPSIAVLPFENRAADRTKDWIGDGLTESIISTLALSPDMVVIARATSFSYKGRAVTTQDVSRELGVRYVLSGSVQSDDKRLRVTAELADAVAGKLIWSVQEDRVLNDIFDVQDEIAQKIFEEMQVSLTLGESTRRLMALAGDFETWSILFRGRGEFQKFSPQGHQAAERLWLELLEKQPELALTHIVMGYLHWQKIVLGLSTDPRADLGAAIGYSNRANEIEEFGEGVSLAALLAFQIANHRDAIRLAERAVELAPGSADNISIAGLVLSSSGQPETGLELMLRSMRLEPHYPGWLPEFVTFAYLELGRLKDAKALAQAVLASNTEDARAKPIAQERLVAIAIFENDLKQAQAEAQKLLKMVPGLTLQMTGQSLRAHYNREFVEKYFDALRKAGVPDN